MKNHKISPKIKPFIFYRLSVLGGGGGLALRCFLGSSLNGDGGVGGWDGGVGGWDGGVGGWDGGDWSPWLVFGAPSDVGASAVVVFSLSPFSKSGSGWATRRPQHRMHAIRQRATRKLYIQQLTVLYGSPILL